MIVDPLFYLAALLAVLLSGISTGGFGAGVGMLAVPGAFGRTLPSGAGGTAAAVV